MRESISHLCAREVHAIFVRVSSKHFLLLLQKSSKKEALAFLQLKQKKVFESVSTFFCGGGTCVRENIFSWNEIETRETYIEHIKESCCRVHCHVSSGVFFWIRRFLRKVASFSLYCDFMEVKKDLRYYGFFFASLFKTHFPSFVKL